MIKIDEAEKIINDHVEAKPYEKDLTREGSYLLFEDVSINNTANIDYNFTLYVATAFFNKDRRKAYEALNKALNEINKTSKIVLESCKQAGKSKNLLIYKLKLKVNIIG